MKIETSGSDIPSTRWSWRALFDSSDSPLIPLKKIFFRKKKFAQKLQKRFPDTKKSVLDKKFFDPAPPTGGLSHFSGSGPQKNLFKKCPNVFQTPKKVFLSQNFFFRPGTPGTPQTPPKFSKSPRASGYVGGGVENFFFGQKR